MTKKYSLAASLIVLLNLMVAPGSNSQQQTHQVVEESQCGLDRQDEALHCFLRTLQSPIGPDGSDVNRVKKLRLRCADNFFLESSMSSDHFGQLPQLEELHIKYCKLRHLPPAAFAGLANLKRLQVQSHNGDWAAVLMDVSKDALQKLSNLRTLDLTFNNLWALPQGSLCDLTNLRKLNLSYNHFVDAADIGLSSGCQLPELKVIDLSSNHIASLKKDDFGASLSANLEVLNLRDNRLEILSDDALASMKSLHELNLADNQLAALPPKLFSSPSLATVETLLLQNNSLTLLTPDLFSGLTGLVMLNLSHNAIANHLVDPSTFIGLTSLRVLDLSYNRLAQLEAKMLASLTSLQVLDISHNQIHTVEGQLSASLKIVSMSYNVINSLSEDAFRGLGQMTSLSLDHNKIRYVPDKLLQSSDNLEDLSFNGNELIEVPKTLEYLPNLRTLDLGENSIVEIKSSDFNPLTKLYGLRLAGNKIKIIRKGHLENVTGIHVLNLAHNELTTIERGALDSLRDLRALRLDNNYLSDINGLVSSLSKLQWFNVSSNKLQWFDYAFVPMSLEWLDIQYNEIEELGNYYKLKSGFSLKRLDASGNLIRSLSKLSLPMSLEQLSLNKNAIRNIESGVFEDKPNLHRVELVDNEINHLKLSALSVGLVSPKGQPEFFLAGNPFVCDCELEWLPEINSVEMQDHHPRVSDLAEIKCRLNNQPRNDTIINVINVDKSQFLCSYNTHCFSLCMCCEFYACDCRMQCPEGCSCFHDSTWDTNIIQCGLRGHKDVPLLIPMDATEIRLDGNNLTNVDSQSFIGRKRVTALYMNHSLVTSISAQTFSGLSNLEVLYLQNNNLREIVGHEFEALLSLRELYLQNNNIVRIAQSAFEAMPMLNILRLDGNLLTSFPVWTLAASNPFLGTLYLAENMWSCECSFAKPFRTYVHTFSDRVADQVRIRCVTDSLVNEPMLDAESYIMCPESSSSSHPLIEGSVANMDPVELSAGDNLVTILVSVVVAFTVLVCGFFAICCYRNRIKNWLYDKSSEIYESRSAASSVTSDGTRNKLFDVFICYSREDEDFVDQSLAPTLEHGSTSYRLCLHQRDFPPTASIYDTVSVATESSARVLIVLSRPFVTSEWPSIKIPLRNALHGRENKLVFLLLDDMTSEELEADPELGKYLKVCALVKWGSSGFLNKLRFFLPEPAIQTFQRSVTLRTLQPSVISSPMLDSSPVGSVATQSTTVYNHHHHHHHQHVRPHHIHGSMGTLYSQHTYQSIPEAHIYHTLDPMEAAKANISGAVYINKNLELILKPTSPLKEESSENEERKADTIQHIHSQSTLSGQQLLHHESDEYVV